MHQVKKRRSHEFGKGEAEGLFPFRVEAPEIAVRIGNAEEIHTLHEIVVELFSALPQFLLHPLALRDVTEHRERGALIDIVNEVCGDLDPPLIAGPSPQQRFETTDPPVLHQRRNEPLAFLRINPIIGHVGPHRFLHGEAKEDGGALVDIQDLASVRAVTSTGESILSIRRR